MAQFRFRKTDQIGAASAEDDAEFLRTCYVDTGDLDLIKDTDDHRVIVLGRTGSGKSALLKKLTEVRPNDTIEISPDNLALAYVSNSTILKFFADLGVNLDPFFKLLWRHVFTVEILSHHLEREGEQTQSIVDRLCAMFASSSRKDKEMREAIDYLTKWGKSFWLETEYRVKEITETLESELGAQAEASVGVSGAKLASRMSAGESLTKEQKSELTSRAQQIVSQTQVQDLRRVTELLDSVLISRNRKYYVTVDSLDENWVEERLRYRLIMALIVAARDFIQIHNAKVVLALRRDLLDRVFRLTRPSGFQEEKYHSLYLPLQWSRGDLLEVLDRRVNELVRRRYTKQTVRHQDLLPRQVNKTPISDLIASLTTTPRDIIALFNACIAVGTGRPKLTVPAMKEALGQYSRSRLRALGDEWSADFPQLLDFTKILNGRTSSFKLTTIAEGEIEDLCLDICASTPDSRGILRQRAMSLVDCMTTAADFRSFLMQVFYRIGLVGLKLQPHESPSWVQETGRSVSASEITEDISIAVHPKYIRALGVKP